MEAETKTPATIENSHLSNSVETIDTTKSSSLLQEDVSNKLTSATFDRAIAEVPGWRFWCTMLGLYSGLFTVTLEMTIVNTALISISDDLQDFKRAPWIINAYLLTWSGSLILWAQFSHTIGRKSCLLTAIGAFIVFSVACAVAQTSIQLIIFRAFQGLAGGGIFQLPAIIITEVVSPSSLPKYVAFNGVVTIISLGVGPLIGGAIAANTTWRWVFLIDVPLGVFIFIVDMIAIPNGLPHHLKPKDQRPALKLAALRGLDVLGAILFLCASIMLAAALQEADSSLGWASPGIICLLIFSIVCWIGFILWERYVSLRLTKVMPLMTWRFAKRRPVAMFATSFLIGITFVTPIVEIPQYLQILENQSLFQVGVNLLPFVVMVAFGAALGSFLGSELKMKATVVMLIGAAIQLAATISWVVRFPHASSTSTNSLPPVQYVFQILLGLGNGISYAMNLNGMPFVLEGDRTLVAPAMGANQQFRYLGGALGLGTLTAALNATLKMKLASFLSPDQVSAIMRSSTVALTLDEGLRAKTLEVFAEGLLLQWKIVCGTIGLQILTILLTW